ncbi:AAA family ATPase [Chitinophaga sancti]|uniref:AAA family ATPase n=1 Tax=Chitinophaga sancti TaxID=1004 RepID=UPI002A754339|nr:AAA family ATPase [Chitinophaga sancti]WPQ63301.1 AAA family ATPase [Chitinophaga sancti]
MVKQDIITFTNTVWKNLKPIRDDIYRGDWMSLGQNKAAVCYLDLGNEKIFENLKEYQEELIAEEYYQTPGGIQWNYYLFVIRDSFNETDKLRIENDDIYARKYLLQPKQFENFFKLDAGSDSIAPDILSEWKTELDSVGLSEVYQNASIASATRRFIEQQSIQLQNNPAETTTQHIEFLNKINRIVLNEDYRKYPDRREFQFGTMNLITGKNGAGKTSLLEAIELSICGKSLREPKKEIIDTSLTMFVNDSETRFLFNPSNSSIYRDRDKQWYGNSIPRGNDLYLSFNRFNYYNADAAREFTDGDSESKTNEALSNLVLGAEFSHLIDRAEKFLIALRPEYNALKKELRSQETAKKESQEKIKHLEKSNDIKALADLVYQDYLALDPINVLTFSEDGLGALEAFTNRIQIFLSPFIENNFKINSFANLEKIKSELATDLFQFGKFQEDIFQFSQRKTVIEILISESNSRLEALARAHHYVGNDLALELNGYSHRKSELDLSFKSAEYVDTLLINVDLEKYKITKTFHSLNEELLTKQQILSKAIQDIDLQIETNQIKGVTLGQLLTQIKIAGKQMLEIFGKMDICPLCEANYVSEELSERINREIINIEESDAKIEILRNKRAELNSNSTIILNEISDLEQLRTAFSFHSRLEIDSLVMYEIVNDLLSILNSRDNLREKQERLNKVAEWANLAGLSEEEFYIINSKISQWPDVQLELSINSKEEIISYEQQLRDTILTAKKELFDINASLLKLDQEIQSRFSSLIVPPLIIAALRTQLDTNRLEIEKLENSFLSLRELVKLSDETTISTFAEAVKVFQSDIEFLRKVQKEEAQLTAELKIIDNASKFLELNNRTLDRLENAITVLAKMVEDRGKNALQDFFSANQQLINDIYNTIHSPQEFISVSFSKTGISLTKADGSLHGVNQISTGQRSALAISLFIALNRQLKQGPKILLFDDPAAFTDDFNILSLLDFLRFFILKEGKQIFFATANARLAALIEKKFDFMGEDFKQFHLER